MPHQFAQLVTQHETFILAKINHLATGVGTEKIALFRQVSGPGFSGVMQYGLPSYFTIRFAVDRADGGFEVVLVTATMTVHADA